MVRESLNKKYVLHGFNYDNYYGNCSQLPDIPLHSKGQEIFGEYVKYDALICTQNNKVASHQPTTLRSAEWMQQSKGKSTAQKHRNALRGGA